MATRNPDISIITLSVNGLIAPTKRLVSWKKKNSTICWLQETHLSCKNKQSKRKEMENDISRKWHPEQSIAILTFDKNGFKIKT